MDGHLYYREGINANNPDGKSWKTLEGPRVRCMASASEQVLGKCFMRFFFIAVVGGGGVCVCVCVCVCD